MKEVIFDKYEIIKEIGSGGYGKVYLAKDIHLSKPVAVKCIKCGDIAGISEAHILKDLKHRGLPAIYDLRKTDDEVYIIMEYIEGITLSEYIEKRGAVPLHTALSWIYELIDILSFLHGSTPQIIYRDLKSANIMITEDNHIRLIDFGGALIKDYSADEDRDNFATPGYGAPELFKGQRADERSDIYSLGAVFFELLTGICPVNAGYKRISVRQYNKSIPKGLDKITEKCLMILPERRYQSMGALKEDLDNYKRIGLTEGVLNMIKVVTLIAAYLTALVTTGLFVWSGLENGGGLEADFLSGLRAGSTLSYVNYKIPIMLWAATLLLTICLKGKNDKKANVCKTEKEIFLTDKRYLGIMAVLFMLIGGAISMLISGTANKSVYAEGMESRLWVEMKDISERKLLLQSGGIYDVTDKVRFEIPAEDLPEGDASIKIIAEDDEGNRFVSREFKVRR